ncbi:MAG: hypothetical protein EOO91_00090 [Pedobacter sp.]|nr:MAG: hypothetical protein EOO91_00090 [Pedobacter sp.]
MKYSTVNLAFICAFALFIACGKEIKSVVAETAIDPLDNYFKGEVRPDNVKPCFNGAYYRKVVSSKDYWLGIGGKVTLPTMTFDPLRVNPAKPGQYLDNPSIYLGGNMGGQETDIGLTWEVIKDANGNVTADRRAFRPFLRRTGLGAQVATYENAPAMDMYYWYPGEEISISLQLLTDKKLKFIVEGAGKRFEKDFDADGYSLNGLGEFKRVNAIDQVANEGKPAQSTKTKVENAQWSETYLFRSYRSSVTKVPLHSGRLTDMRCPASSYFAITASVEEMKKGAEKVNINGNGY